MPDKLSYCQHATDATLALTSAQLQQPPQLQYGQSKITFDADTSTGLLVEAENITSHSHSLLIDCDQDILLNSTDCVEFIADAEIEIATQQLQLTINNETIKIDNHTLINNFKTVLLSTPEITQPLNIACVGDQHQCPQINGDDPHEGGVIVEGSPNVFVNGKAVARHNDMTLCQQQFPNPIISTITSITVNNKAIATQHTNTTHGGKIITGQSQYRLTNASPHLQQSMPSSSNTTNQLTLSQPDSTPRHFNIHFCDKAVTTQTSHQNVTITNLTVTELTSTIQICLDDT